jgi:xylulokinase
VSSFVGIDVGTSATKALAIDREGRVTGRGERAHQTIRPRPGFSEQDPEVWVRAAESALGDLNATEVAGWALTGQMHGLVLLDARQRVLRPAMLWNDGRASLERRMIEQRIGLERLLELVANRSMPGFTASSLLWIREHEPEVWERVRMIMLPKDYVRWRLFGGDPVTDVSDASGTLLFDVRRRCWSPEMLDALEIEPGMLPDVTESTVAVGWAQNGAPVGAGAGDQAAAALGTGLKPDGQIGVALGTSGVVMRLTSAAPTADVDGRLQELCGCGEGIWQSMGVTLAAGGALAWWQRCSGGEPLTTLLAEAERWPVGCDGLTFLPYLSGERAPYLDGEIRGSFAELADHHERGAMTRAVVEGIACSLAEVLAVVSGPTDGTGTARVSGGLARSPLVAEIVASILGRTLEHCEVDDATSFGAAVLAGVVAGGVDGLEEGAGVPRVRSVTEPNPAELEAYRRLREGFRRRHLEAVEPEHPREGSGLISSPFGRAGADPR